MDKDRIKGAVDDAKGRVERQVGEWTGDKETMAKGAADQVKGKAEKAWGNVKDAGRDVADKVSETADKVHDKVKDGARKDNEIQRDKELDEDVA